MILAKRYVITTKQGSDELTLRHAGTIRTNDAVTSYTDVIPAGWVKEKAADGYNRELVPAPGTALRRRWNKLAKIVADAEKAANAIERPASGAPREAWDKWQIETAAAAAPMRPANQEMRKLRDEATAKARKLEAKNLDKKPAKLRRFDIGDGQSGNGQALTKRVRVMRPRHVAQLNRIEAAIKKLQAQRRKLIVSAWQGGIVLETPEKVMALAKGNLLAAGVRDRRAFIGQGTGRNGDLDHRNTVWINQEATPAAAKRVGPPVTSPAELEAERTGERLAASE